MSLVITQLSSDLCADLSRALQSSVTSELLSLQLNTDKPASFGDLNSNLALKLAPELRQPPRALAEKIITIINANKLFQKLCIPATIAGPGFINFSLNETGWATLTRELLADGAQPRKTESPQRYLVEFVSANPTGPLHLAHGRNGVIGDVLCSILSFLGHKVTREYYINDAGSQIKKLGASLQVRYLQECGNTEAELPEDGYSGTYLCELAETLKTEVGTEWENYTTEQFAHYAKTAMLELIKTDLNSYGIRFDHYSSEQEIHESGAVETALRKLVDKGATFEEDGALWLRSTEYGDDKDRVLKKANGELTYLSPDIAYYDQNFSAGYDKLINILGQDHHGYVLRRNAALKALGHPVEEKFSSILYQLVRMKKSDTYVRMSKRSGSFEKLSDVIQTVGKDVARFFYLNRKADAHLEFDLDVALKQTDENPAYYIQYAFVRTRGIFDRAREQMPELAELIDQLESGKLPQEFQLSIPQTAHILVKKMLSFDKVLASIAQTHQTHQLAYYTLELSQLFHTFYGQTRIITPDNPKASGQALVIVATVRTMLGCCLDLLGLSKPTRM